MKHSNKIFLTAALLASLQSGGAVQAAETGAIVFDFEPVFTIATQTGATHVGPDTLYGPGHRFGWTHAISIDRAHDRDTPDSPFYFQRKDFTQYNLVRDGVTVIGPNTFTAEVPNGNYRVTMHVGDFGPKESRDNLFATFNGLAVMNDESTAGGQVKSYSFPVQVSNGKIVLHVDGRGHQRYFPLNGLVLQPMDSLPAFAVKTQRLPAQEPSAASYAAGWARYVESLREDWDRARAELQQEGNWSEIWPVQLAAIRRQNNHRTVFASGSTRFDELSKRAGGQLDLKGYAAVIREIGLDGLIVNDRSAHSGLAKNGVQVALGGPGFEGLLPGALTSEAFNHVLDRNTSTTSVLDQAYTPYSPLARDFFTKEYSQRFLPMPAESKFMMVDEIRGSFAAGHLLGDYSPAAATAFTAWAAAQKVKLSSPRLPRPARSWDFYHFYRFRLGAVPRFARDFTKGSALSKTPIYLGNGFLGPEYANHNSLWGPDAVRAGFGLASWDYDGNKASAEFMAAMEREYNGKVQNWTALWHTPTQDLNDATIVASAATRQFSIWHQGTFIESANRVPWMKTAYLATRLAQALSNVSHRTNVYIYAPDSLVFNDLVGGAAQSEFGRWKQIADSLGKGNIDFKVTHSLDVPAKSLVIYAPYRSVLRPDEAAALRAYIQSGSALLYASDSQPEEPDTRPLSALRAALKARNVTQVPGMPEAATVRRIAAERDIEINPACDAPGVRTFAYRRGLESLVLLTNTDLKSSAKVTVGQGFTDVFSGSRLEGDAVEMAAGHYRLLRRN